MLIDVVTKGWESPKSFTVDVSMEDLNKAIYNHNSDPRREFLWFNDEKTDMVLIIPIHDLLWIQPAEKNDNDSES